MAVKLKPCPFCGNCAQMVAIGKDIHGAPKYQVYCEECNFGAESAYFSAKQDAINAWNRRTPHAVED